MLNLSNIWIGLSNFGLRDKEIEHRINDARDSFYQYRKLI